MRCNAWTIYKITNTLNGKAYVGRTRDVETRKTLHFSALRNGRHNNQTMQEEYTNQNGKGFVFELLEETDYGEQEFWWQAFYKTCDTRYGYNNQDPFWSRLDPTKERGDKFREMQLHRTYQAHIEDLFDNGIEEKKFEEFMRSIPRTKRKDLKVIGLY